MATPAMLSYLVKAKAAAAAAGHKFPGAAAAESAIECSWGQSQSAVKYNNLIGLTKPSWYDGKTFLMYTEEFLKEGQAIPVSWIDPTFLRFSTENGVQGRRYSRMAEWCAFDDWTHCFLTMLQVFQHDAE